MACIYMSSKYCHLWFIIFVLYCIFLEAQPFAPNDRLAHSSVLVGDRLYFFGGTGPFAASTLNETFYLDVSKPLNTANLSWHKVTDIPIGSAYATVALGRDSENNYTYIYLFEGI